MNSKTSFFCHTQYNLPKIQWGYADPIVLCLLGLEQTISVELSSLEFLALLALNWLPLHEVEIKVHCIAPFCFLVFLHFLHIMVICWSDLFSDLIFLEFFWELTPLLRTSWQCNFHFKPRLLMQCIIVQHPNVNKSKCDFFPLILKIILVLLWTIWFNTPRAWAFLQYETLYLWTI